MPVSERHNHASDYGGGAGGAPSNARTTNDRIALSHRCVRAWFGSMAREMVVCKGLQTNRYRHPFNSM